MCVVGLVGVMMDGEMVWCETEKNKKEELRRSELVKSKKIK